MNLAGTTAGYISMELVGCMVQIVGIVHYNLVYIWETLRYCQFPEAQMTIVWGLLGASSVCPKPPDLSPKPKKERYLVPLK